MAGEESSRRIDNDEVIALEGPPVALDDEEGEDPPETLRRAIGLWDLTQRERHWLYRTWMRDWYTQHTEQLASLQIRYDRNCKELNRMEQDLQVEVLSSARIIGMTTTAVAKYQPLLQAIQPEIVVVEEAAEVLESHIVTALTGATKQVILIGDHQQLRPGTAVYRLATHYNLDVSLFERLVRNGLPHVTLSRQRRMRTEISKLIAPIYPNLRDHPDVLGWPSVRGVVPDMFFLDHSEPEGSNNDSASKTNKFEAAFTTALCAYLLRNGYMQSQITILSTYVGQLLLIKRRLREAGMVDVLATTVDNYQGEENDIILLSLVRSNTISSIGFLSISNRVCVALSRARHGFYIVGNAALLASKTKLWRQIFEYLRAENLMGKNLPLQLSSGQTSLVHCAEDFDALLEREAAEHDGSESGEGGDCGENLGIAEVDDEGDEQKL